MEQKKEKVTMIALGGGSGSGKTTIVKRLLKESVLSVCVRNIVYHLKGD